MARAVRPAKPSAAPRWRKVQRARLALAEAAREPCARCGQPIDHKMSGMHPMGPDHRPHAAGWIGRGIQWLLRDPRLWLEVGVGAAFWVWAGVAGRMAR